jgi:DMSO/TMAO reductase YedYZ molybdopterin-dependent catalytic subunit
MTASTELPNPPRSTDRNLVDRPWIRATIAGLLSMAAALVAGWFAAELLDVGSPVADVGNRVVDHTPTGVREWAISTFGTSDKNVLQIGTVLILAIVSILVARAAMRWRPLIVAGPVVFGLIGVVSSHPNLDGQAAYLPPIVAAVVAIIGLQLLIPRPAHGKRADAEDAWTSIDRRRFLVRAAAISATAAGAGAIASIVSGSRSDDIATTAKKLRFPLPNSADAVEAVPAAASVGDGVTPFITRNSKFYRIDTALAVPRVSIGDWTLKITGMVDHPMELDFDQLASRRVIERVITLCCVSNYVGGDLVGNARWLGVPLADLLDEAGVDPKATQIASRSVDGFTAGFPTSVGLDGRDAMVAIGMNGVPLPSAHGFPARLVVPGLYGYVSATKWLSEIELTTEEKFDGYWIPRGWSKDGPVKTQSRIDVPSDGDELRAGPVPIAGVAWAQHKGITGVQVRVDGGAWQAADMGTDVSKDAWRQWVYRWDAKPGDHQLQVRAMDGTGTTQTGEPADPAPNGAQGWHTIQVSVSR